MKEWKINGHSDDIITIINDAEYNEEFDVFGSHHTDFTLSIPDDEGVLIRVSYECNGSWHIGVSALDELKPLSEKWAFSLYPSNCGYKNLLVVTAPDNAALKKS